MNQNDNVDFNFLGGGGCVLEKMCIMDERFGSNRPDYINTGINHERALNLKDYKFHFTVADEVK